MAKEKQTFLEKVECSLNKLHNKGINFDLYYYNGKYNLSNQNTSPEETVSILDYNKQMLGKMYFNKLILTPNSETITLTYPDTLHIRAKMDFDFLFFGAILILTFLLAYKLSNYVAEFNTIKGKSRVEVIFLTIFFIFLFIPMLHINQEDISQRENRTLAQWKPLIQENNTINFEFDKDFNNWFDDRFNLRELFLKIHDLKFILSRNLMTENIMKGPDDWLFLSWKDSIDSYANSLLCLG